MDIKRRKKNKHKCFLALNINKYKNERKINTSAFLP